MAATVIAGNDFGLLDSSLTILKRGDRTSNGGVAADLGLNVNASNGNLVVQQRDTFMPSMGDDFEITRTYNSLAKEQDEHLWRMSYEIELKFKGPLIEVEKADGSVFEYHLNEDTDIWTSTDGGTAYETIEKVKVKDQSNPDPSLEGETWGYVLTLADQTQMFFDVQGQLQASVDANGVRMDYEYDNHNLLRIFDDEGHEISFEYDKKRRLTAILDESQGVLVSYEYDKDERLVAVTDRMGHVTRYEYDKSDLLIGIELPDQQKTESGVQHYDARKLTFGYSHLPVPATQNGHADLLTSITDAEGGITTFTYTENEHPVRDGGFTQVVDALGNARAYSNESEFIAWREANGYYSIYELKDKPKKGDTHNEVILYQASLIREQHSLTYHYNEEGYLQEVVDQQGYRTKYFYNANNDLIRAEDNNAWALTHSDSEYYRDMRARLGVVDAMGAGKRVAELTAADRDYLVDQHASDYEYDDNGNLIRYTDNNGTVSTFVYDEFNNLTEKTSSEYYRLLEDNSQEAREKRQFLGFAEDATLLTDAEKSAMKAVFTSHYVYDDRQNLIESHDNDGDLIRYTYDAYGNVSTRTVFMNPDDLVSPEFQQVTRYFYDALGNNTEVIDAEGNHTYAEYDHFGNLLRSVDGNGGVTTFIYDNDNRLTSKTDAEGNTVFYSYDAVGNRISATDENGHTIVSIYDRNNRLVTVINPSENDASRDRITSFAYDVLGNQTSVTNARGATTTYSYDNRYQLVRTTTAEVTDVDGETESYHSSFDYDALGNKITQTDNKGNIRSFYYNEDSVLIEAHEADGHINQYRYDSRNNQVSIVVGAHLADEAKRQVIQYRYDEEDQVVSMTDAEGNTTQYDYDAAGNRIEVENARGFITDFEYDALNRQVRVTHPEVINPENGQPKRYTQEYKYDANSNVIRVTDENEEVTQFHFDRNNRQILVEDANGIFTQYGYDAKGQRISIEIGADIARDAEGNLKRVTSTETGQSVFEVAERSEASLTTYHYDEFGQVIAETDALGNSLMSSNLELYRQLRQELGLNADADNLSVADHTLLAEQYSRQYDYDRMGNLTSETDRRGNTQTIEYDELNRAIRQVNREQGVVEFKYDGNNNRVSMRDELGRITEMQYDVRDRLTQTDIAVGTEHQVAEKLVLDTFGNVTTRIEAYNSADERSFGFEYDLNNRVTAAINPESDRVAYEYDEVGNRRFVKDGRGNITEYVYDARNQNIKIIDPETFTQRYEYDGVGNVVSMFDKNNHKIKYVFDPGNRMLSMVQLMEGEEDRITSFTYDALGRQTIVKTAVGTAEEQVTEYEYDSVGNLRKVIDDENGITENGFDREYNQTDILDANGHRTSMTYDAMGRVLTVTDALNQVTEMDYDAVGNQLWIKDAEGNRTVFEYDSRNRKIIERDALLIETHYDYDDVNNQVTITRAHGTADEVVQSFSYYDDGQLKSRTDIATGDTVTYTYDENNNVKTVTNEEGHTTSYEYDKNNRVKTITDPEDGVVEYGYDGNGNRVSVTDQEGHTTISFFNEANQATLVIDPEGYAREMTYDANGNLTHETRRMTQLQGPFSATDRPVIVTSADDQITEYRYDGLNRLTEVIDAEGFVKIIAYDAVGNKTSVTQLLDKEPARSSTTHYFYDKINRLDMMVTGEGLLTKYTYDKVGHRKSQSIYETPVVITDGLRPEEPAGVVRTTTFEYDDTYRTKTETSAEGIVTQYEYDKRGNVTRLIEALGTTEQRETEKHYDSLDRLTFQIDAKGEEESVATKFTYYRDGELETRTDAYGSEDAVVTTFYYDDNNRLERQTSPDGDGQLMEQTFTYDGAGNRTSWTIAVGSEYERAYHYDYNKNNQLTQEVLPFDDDRSIVNEYVYDGAGNRTEAHLAVGSAEARSQYWAYNRNNQIDTYTDARGVQARYEYNGTGQITRTHENSGEYNDDPVRSSENRYDLDGRLTETYTAEGVKTSYVYDALGNAIQKTVVQDADTPVLSTMHMAYDKLGRQTAVLSAEGSLTTYQYDEHNNLIEERRFSETFSLMADGTIPEGSGEARTTTFDYNLLGQLVSRSNSNGRVDTFTYDDRGNMTVMAEGERITTMRYNDADHLIGKTEFVGDEREKTTTYIVDEYGNTRTRIDAQGTPDARTSYFDYDAANNVTSEARVTGVTEQGDEIRLVTEYEYNSFGDLTTKVAAAGTAESRTTTYQYDQGSNLTLETVSPGFGYDDIHTSYQYDAAGNQTHVTTGAGSDTPLTTVFDFDKDNRLISVVRPDDVETRYEYDGLNNLIRTIEAVGSTQPRETLYTYDLDGQLTLMTDAMGFTTAYQYDNYGNQTQITQLLDQATDTQPARYATTYQYFDLTGRITHVIDAEGYLSSFEYDLFDQLTLKKEYLDAVLPVSEGTPEVAETAVARVTEYDYDLSGNLTHETDTLGQINHSKYDLFNNLTHYHERWDAETQTSERLTTYAFDKLDRLTLKTDAADTDDALITRFVYNHHDQVVLKTEALGTDKERASEYLYDDSGRLARESSQYIDIDGDLQTLQVRYTYDEHGNLNTQASGQYHSEDDSLTVLRSTTYTYDLNNRVDTETNAEGEVTKYEYNAHGDVSWIHVGFGTTDQRSNYSHYDLVGNLDYVIDGEGVETAYEYDGLKNKTLTIQAKDVAGEERVTQYTYDLKGQLESVTDPEGGVTDYEYDYLGNQVRITDANGGVHQNQFDLLGRNRIELTAGGIKTVTTYDVLGRKETEKTGFDDGQGLASDDFKSGIFTQVTFEHDSLDRQTVITDGEGFTTRFTYDAAGNQTHIIQGLYEGDDEQKKAKEFVVINEFSYDLAGRMLSKTDGEGNTTQYAYNAVGDRIQVIDPLNESVDEHRITEYRYDKAGRQTDEISNAGGHKVMQYDETGLLKKESQLQSEDRNGNQVWTWVEYTYDGNGRIQTETRPGSTSLEIADDKVEYVTTENIVTRYEYDAVGNQTDLYHAYGTDDERHIRMEYDANNRKVADIDGETHRTSYEYDAQGNQIRVTDAEGRQAYYYYNASNELVAIIDPTGTVTEYEYDAYGNEKVYLVRASGISLASLGESERFDLSAVRELFVDDDKDRYVSKHYDKNGNLLSTMHADDHIDTFTYDALGNLKKEALYSNLGEDKARITSYGYDLNNRLVHFVDVDKTETTFDYDSAGNKIAEVITAEGKPARTVAYEYDLANRLTSQITDQGGLNITETMAYDRVGNVISKTDPNGHVMTYEYDLNDRLIRQTNAEGITTYNGYDRVGNRISVVNGKGAVTNFEYDDNNREVAIILPLAEHTRFIDGEWRTESTRATTTRQYDAFGNEVQTIDNDGFITTRWFDANGRQIGELNADHYFTRMAYNEFGELVSHQIYTAQQIPETHDPDVLPDGFSERTTQDPQNKNAGYWITTTYQYDDAGNQTQVTLPQAETHRLDTSTGQPRAVAMEQAIETREYDAFGNEVAFTNAAGDTSYMFYDNMDRMTAMIDADGFLTQWQYDAQGNTTHQTQHSARVNTQDIVAGEEPDAFTYLSNNNTVHTIVREYDAANRLVRETQPETQLWDRAHPQGYTSTIVTEYRYDNADNQTLVIRDADGLAVREYYYYDDINRLVASVDQRRVLSVYAHDKNDNITEQKRFYTRIAANVNLELATADSLKALMSNQTHVRDQEILSDYDALNRLSTETTVMAGDDIEKTYAYDARGNQTDVTEHEFDGLQAAVESGDSYDYDDIAPSYTTKTVYDSMGRVSRTESPDGNISSSTFDALGNVTNSYTGELNSAPVWADGVEVTLSDTVDITWATGGRGFVVFDSSPHPAVDEADKALVESYANQTGVVAGTATSSVSLDLAVGDTRYFRIITFDKANNWNISEEYSVTRPPVVERAYVAQEGDDYFVYVNFDAAVDSASLTFSGGTQALEHVSGTTYRYDLTDGINPDQTFTIAWVSNGKTYQKNQALLLGSNLSHQFLDTQVYTYQESNGYSARIELDARGLTEISDYERVTVEWRNLDDQDADPITASFDDPNGNDASNVIEILLGVDNDVRLSAGSYQVTIRGNGSNGTDVLQQFGYTVAAGDNSASVSHMTLALPNDSISDYLLVSGRERISGQSVVIDDTNYAVIDTPQGLTGAYELYMGQAAEDAHNTEIEYEEVRNNKNELLGYDVKFKTDFPGSEWSHIANQQVTWEWGAVGSESNLSQSANIEISGGRARHEFFTSTGGTYQARLTYIDTNGRTVVSDWLEFNTAGDEVQVTGKSLTVMLNEVDGRLTSNDLKTGLSDSEYALVTERQTIDLLENDATRGRFVRTGEDTGYFVKNIYNARGHLIATNDDTGIWREFKVDAYGNQIEERVLGVVGNTNDNRTSYSAFDSRGNETQTWSSEFDGDAHQLESQKFYDYQGNLIREVHADNSATEFEYDAFGNVLEERHYDINSTTAKQKTIYGYDALGRETRMVDAVGYGIERTYDAYGDVNAEYKANRQSAGGSAIKTTYTYDAFGRRITMVETTTERTYTTAYQYDAADRLTQLTEPGTVVTKFTLDSRGNRVVVEKGGYRTVEIYDDMGRVITRVTNFDTQRVSEKKTYDIFGNLLSETDQEGRTISRRFGDFGRLAEETDQDGRRTVYEYDEYGNEETITKYSHTVRSEPYEGEDTYTYTLDKVVIRKTYYADNRLHTVKEYDDNGNLGVNTTYTYDDRGNRHTEVIKQGSTTLRSITYGFNNRNELASWVDTVTGDSMVYEYDNGGRLTKVTTEVNNQGQSKQEVITYHYNAYGQLKTVKKDGVETDKYTYYQNGQMATSTTGGVTYTYKYNAKGQVERSTWNDGKDYSIWEYDDLGNTKKYERKHVVTNSEGNDEHVTKELVDNKYIGGTSYVYESESYNKDEEGQKESSTTTTTFDRSGRSSFVDIDGETHIWNKLFHSASGLKLKEKLDGDDVSGARTQVTYTSFDYDGNGQLEHFKKDKGTKDEREAERFFVYNNDGQILKRSVIDNKEKTSEPLVDLTDEPDYINDEGEYRWFKIFQDVDELDSGGFRDINEEELVAWRAASIAKNEALLDDVTYKTDYHYANGKAVGATGKDDEGEALAELGTGDYSPVKHLNADFPTGAISSFTATGGETLKQLAGILLGNQNLWFVLAEANGLSATDTLSAGQSITIPNNVETAHFDSETHKVYNESEIIGNTMPNVRQKKKKKKCGSFLAIVITVVVVVAAAVLTGGAAVAIAGAVTSAIGTGAAAIVATVVLTAVAGAAIYAGLNIVQQGLMIVAGLQEGFDWNQVRDQARQGAFAGAMAGLGAYAGLPETAESTRKIINVSKTALNVAYKAHQQVKQNGEITNWTGLLMAAAPALSEFEAIAGAAEAISEWGAYATPWLNLAEKALNGDNISNEDVIQAAAGTLTAAIDDSDSAIGKNFVDDNVMQNVAKAVTAGAIYLGDRDAARDYLQTTIGQEVGEYLSDQVGEWITADSTLGKLGVQGTALATLQAGVSGFANTYLTTRMRSDTGASEAIDAAVAGLQGSMQSGAVEAFAQRTKLQSEIQQEQQQAQLLAVARELATQKKDITPEMLADAERQIADGDIKTPEIQLIDGLADEQGILGAYNSDSKAIEIDRTLYQSMLAGDEEATAQFQAVYMEELAHSVASKFEQRLDIQDFKYDEGALVAKALLERAVKNGDLSFSVEVDGSYQTFTTSEEALQNTIDRDFSLNRIYQDYQDGVREFRGMDGGFYKNRNQDRLSPEQSALGVLEFLANGLYNTGVDAAAGIGGLGVLIRTAGDVEKSAETIAWVQENFGLDLQTEGGQAFAQALAESTVGQLAAAVDNGTTKAGDAVLDATGSPFLATLVAESPEILASVLSVVKVFKRGKADGPEVVPNNNVIESTVGKNNVQWVTDSNGLPLESAGTLKEYFKGAKRSPAEVKAQSAAGQRGLVDDHGGHLVGHRFVLDQGDKNLFPQNKHFNNSAFKTLENDYARFIDQGHSVEFKHVLGDFDSVTGRPGTLRVNYKVFDSSGNLVHKYFNKFNNQYGEVYKRASQ